MKKRPLQVYLDDVVHDLLVAVARKLKTTQSELVRKYIQQGLERDIPPHEDPALQIVGLGESREGDLSTRHDEYLTGRERQTWR